MDRKRPSIPSPTQEITAAVDSVEYSRLCHDIPISVQRPPDYTLCRLLCRLAGSPADSESVVIGLLAVAVERSVAFS